MKLNGTSGSQPTSAFSLQNVNFNKAARVVTAVAVAAVAVHMLTNIPQADALGHFWKSVNKHCYEMCKELHNWEGLACFSGCVTLKHFTEN